MLKFTKAQIHVKNAHGFGNQLKLNFLSLKIAVFSAVVTFGITFVE